MAYQGFDDLYKHSEYQIYFYSYSTNSSFIFPAFVTDFNDSFKSNWTTQEIYGRMDPVATFKNTARSITLSFDIPSADLTNAINNLTNIDRLIKGLYPIYSDGPLGTATISAPPLYSIKFANLIVNVRTGGGLLGYLSGFDFKPDFASGHFINNGTIYPKLLKASFGFNVIHEHPLGSVMSGDKPLPRITLANGDITNGFAHKYDSTTINRQKPTSPVTPTDAQSFNEITLFVARKQSAGTQLPAYSDGFPRIGPIFDVSRKPFTTEDAQGVHTETFTDYGDMGDGKHKLQNKETGEVIIIPSDSSGGTLEYYSEYYKA